MEKKSMTYHLEIQTHRKNPYGLLRHSYREDGKVKKKTLCRFSGLSMRKLKAMQAALQDKTVMKEDFKIIESREYGASFAVIEMMKNLGLTKDIFSRPSEEWVRSVLAMIAGRIVYAGSKLSLSHCGTYSALWDICGIEEASVNNNCYKAMDRLLERQETIQKKLAKKHLRDGSLVLYDITSSYLEGEYEDSELVSFGYNRDKKRGHEQIVISLLCEKKGCPIAVEVLRGNTKDETTVLNKIAEIREKFKIEKVIFVGDRGMVTMAKYNQIDHKTIKVISALSHLAIKKLCNDKVIQIGLFDEKNIVEVISENIRYCLCKNPLKAEEEGKNRQILIEKTTTEIDKILSSSKKSKYTKEVRIGKIINKYKMGKFISLTGEKDNLKYQVNQEKVKIEASLDGCYVVFTDVSPEDLSAIETVKSYKSLIKVEQAFRNMKTVRLEIRPIFHKTDDRIKCHVFICMLSYYIMWHMKQKLAPLFENDGIAANRKYTFDYVVEMLKSIRKETVEFDGVKSSIITTPNNEQNYILKLLQIKL